MKDAPLNMIIVRTGQSCSAIEVTWRFLMGYWIFYVFLFRYQKAIEIYEEIARHSLNNNLLKYGVKGHLLNAGLCQLCKADIVAISNALERYQVLFLAINCKLPCFSDWTHGCTFDFAGTRSYFLGNTWMQITKGFIWLLCSCSIGLHIAFMTFITKWTFCLPLFYSSWWLNPLFPTTHCSPRMWF